MKYLFCYFAEIFHRYCFDKLYVQDRKRIIWSWLCFRLLDFIQFSISDYRRYLKTNVKKYQRYTAQWD
jgi:hypothetical protein